MEMRWRSEGDRTSCFFWKASISVTSLLNSTRVSDPLPLLSNLQGGAREHGGCKVIRSARCVGGCMGVCTGVCVGCARVCARVCVRGVCVEAARGACEEGACEDALCEHAARLALVRLHAHGLERLAQLARVDVAAVVEVEHREGLAHVVGHLVRVRARVRARVRVRVRVSVSAAARRAPRRRR